MAAVRHALTAGAAALLLGVGASGCSSGPDGLSQQALSSAMPTPQDLPGGSWSVVGTTHTRPATMAAVDELAAATGTSSPCRTALTALAQPTPAPAGFARTVLRTSDEQPAKTRNLTLSVETDSATPDRAERIKAVTSACTGTMSTRVGKSDVRMKLVSQEFPQSGYTGYSISYQSEGLTETYSEVVATRANTMVTASINGPEREDNVRVLTAAVRTALGRLDASRQA